MKRSRDLHAETFRSGLLAAGASLVLLSAANAVWVAANGERALLRFAALLAGLVVMAGIVWLGRHRPHWLGWAAFACAIAAALLGGAFLALRLFSSETVAGPLATLVLIGAGGMGWAIRQGRRWARPAGGLLLAVAVVGLLATREESAWLALLAGALAAAVVYWRFGAGRSHPTRRWIDGAAAAGTIGLALLVAALVSTPYIAQLGSIVTNHAVYTRPFIWHDTLDVLQDYPLTGIGLGQTGMVYSTYVYLFHVAFIHQTYNLFLQLAVEQGLLGLVGFVAMVVAAGWQSYRVIEESSTAWRWLYAGVLAALVALVLHGLVDAGTYIGRLMALLFLPLGFGMALPAAAQSAPTVTPPGRSRWFWLGGAAPWVAALVVVGLVGGRSAFYSNLGAVQQTKAELSVYHWPEWPIQDAIRLRHAVDLSGAIASYQQALRYDPANSTALRRLGQIALSQGDTTAARRYLEAAFAQDPEAFVTRLLLGELYAVDGEVDHAVAVWTAGAMDLHKLELRQWWYTEIGADQSAERMTTAIRRYFRTFGASQL